MQRQHCREQVWQFPAFPLDAAPPLQCISQRRHHQDHLPAATHRQSQRGLIAHPDTVQPHGSPAGTRTCPGRSHNTRESYQAPSQDNTVATSRRFWLMSPHRSLSAKAKAGPGAWNRCIHTVPRLQHPSAEGGPVLLTLSPGTQLPGTGMRLPELLTTEASRGLARGLSSERGAHSLPHRHTDICLFHQDRKKK